jgi:hypothetical protein
VPITNSEIHEVIQYGPYKAVRYKVNFDDATFDYVKIRMPNGDADNSKQSEAETAAVTRRKNREAQTAVANNEVPSAGTEATVWDKRRAYIRRAYQEENKVKALNMFDNFYPQMKAYGDAQTPSWTAQDYATALEVDLETVQAIVAKWQDLNGNRAVIEAYEEIL